MTTMELNLRKEYLYDLIKGMDEERLSKVETYIKRLCLAKQKESLYPWAPDEAELTCKLFAIADSKIEQLKVWNYFLNHAKSAEEKTTKKVGFMVKEIQWSKHAEESFTEISDIRY